MKKLLLSLIIILITALLITLSAGASGIECAEDFNDLSISAPLPAPFSKHYAPTAGVMKIADEKGSEKESDSDFCADIGMEAGVKDVCQVKYSFPSGLKKFVLRFRMKTANDAAFHRIKFEDKNGKTASNLEIINSLKIMNGENTLINTCTFPKATWRTVAIAVDTEAGKYSTYVDGVAAAEDFSLPLKNTSSVPVDMDYSEGMFSVWFEVYASLSREAHIYLDDITVYTENGIEIVSAGVNDKDEKVDTELSQIEIAFNNLLGEKGIPDVSVDFASADGTVDFDTKVYSHRILIKINELLSGSTAYTLKISNITDFYGNEVTDFIARFTTTSEERVKDFCLKNSEGMEITEVFPGETYFCTPIIYNNSTDKKQYNLYIVCYSADNTLLGITEKSIMIDSRLHKPLETDTEELREACETGCIIKLFLTSGKISEFNTVKEPARFKVKEVTE